MKPLIPYLVTRLVFITAAGAGLYLGVTRFGFWVLYAALGVLFIVLLIRSKLAGENVSESTARFFLFP